MNFVKISDLYREIVARNFTLNSISNGLPTKYNKITAGRRIFTIPFILALICRNLPRPSNYGE